MGCECRYCKSLLADGLRYCTRCGSRTASLEDRTVQEQRVLIGSGSFTVECVLENTGVSEACVKKCDVYCEQLGINGVPTTPAATPCVEPNASAVFRADLGRIPPTQSALQVRFAIQADDGQRGEFPDWNSECLRQFEVDVQVLITKPGDVSLYPEAIFLSGKVTRSEIMIVNAGGDDAAIRHIAAPTGLRVMDVNNQPIEYPFHVRSGNSSKIIFETADVPSMRDKKVLIDIVGGARKQLPILVPDTIVASFTPSYVVGIDFGTANTSIAIKDVVTKTVNLIPNEDGEPRFPSAMYVQFPKFGGQKFFGATAERYATAQSGEQSDGFLVTQLKTALRQEDDPFEADHGPEYSKRRLTRVYFQHLRDLIVRHFRNNCNVEPDTETDVLYYVTLPVLDKGGERYHRQLHETKCAVEGDDSIPGDRGPFPKNRVVYENEPSSAALHCFHELNKSGRFRALETFTLCLFDSGGGTTDISMLQVGFRNGVPEFTPMGTGCAEVGGVEITKKILDYLDHRSTLAWQAIMEVTPSVAHRMIWADQLKCQLTEKLAQEAERIKPQSSTDLDDVAVRVDDVVAGRGGDDTFSKSEEDKLVEGVLDRLKGCLKDAQVDESIGNIYYALAVGGNSLVPRIREGLYDWFQGDQNPRVLPWLTKSADRDRDEQDNRLGKFGRVLVGDSHEIEAVMEAVARGSVMWYGAVLVKNLPFRILFRSAGLSDQVVAEPDAIFRTRKWALNVDPAQPTNGEILIQSPRFHMAEDGECRLAACQLPVNRQGKWGLDVTLDKNILRLHAYQEDGVRQEIVAIDLESAIDVLG